MSSPNDPESLPPERVEHAPPTILLLFTLFTGIGLVVAGTWILHGNVAITIVGVFGIIIGTLGLLYARHL